MPILLYGLDACPVSPRQLRSLNHVVVLCGRKMFNVNTFVECTFINFYTSLLPTAVANYFTINSAVHLYNTRVGENLQF